MPYICLAKLSPLNPATGTRVDIYVSAASDRRVTGLNSQVWVPAMTVQPILSMQLFNGDFTAAVEPGDATFAINMERIKDVYAGADAYVWAGAPVTIYAEEPGASWPWTTRFVGKVARFSVRSRVVTLTATVDIEPFTKDVLTATYAGTGGAEGGADIKGRVKPLAIGWPMNVEPVLIDATNSVYQFSGYGPIQAVTTLFERGSAFSAAVGDYATYAALVAATIAPGKWGTCLAEGMIRLGAPAYGVITGDIKGHKVGASSPRLTGAIINALATIAGVSSGNIETSTLTTMDAATPYSVNLFLDGQITFLDLARRMALPCSFQAGVSLAGKFFVSGVGFGGSEVLTLDAQGRAQPPVTHSDELQVSPPFYRTILGANRAWRVHTPDEIAYAVTPIVRGDYSGTTTYRDGDIVTSEDGSTWIYVNATPSAGNAPPTWPTTSNAYWSNMTGPGAAVFGTGNRVRFSQFEKDLAGWTRIYNPNSLAAPTYSTGLTSAHYFATMSFSFTASGQVISFGQDTSDAQYSAVVTEGEWLAVQVGVNFTGPVATVGSHATIWFRNAAGSTISSTDLTNTGTAMGGIATLHRGIVAAPANAASAYLEVYATSNGSGAASITITRPSIQGVASGASEYPTFTPGPGNEWGADVTAASQVTFEISTDKTVPASYLGVVQSTDLANIVWTPAVNRGGSSVKVSNSTSYALSNTSGGTFAVDNTNGSSTKGNVTISAMSANEAKADLTVSYEGVALPNVTLKLTKVLADPPPSGGGGGGSYPATVTWSTGEFLGINTTSYTAVVTPAKTVTLASGQSLYGTAPLNYYVSGNGGITRTMTFKWQYAVAGSGSWNDFGTGITGSSAISASSSGAPDYEWYDPVPGYVEVTQTKSGLSAGDYDVRLVAICQATGRTCTPGGLATIEAKV